MKFVLPDHCCFHNYPHCHSPSHFFYRNHRSMCLIVAQKLKVFYNGFGGVWVIPVSPPYCFAHPDLVNVQYLHSGAAQVLHDLDDLSRMNIVDNLGASLFPTSLATVALLVDTVVGGVSLGPHSLTFQNTFFPISKKLAPRILSKSPQLSHNALSLNPPSQRR